MSEIEDFSSITGEELSVEQLRGILLQIDLDITNLLRDGKMAALKYRTGKGGQTADRAGNLKALLEARSHYERLAREAVGDDWSISRGEG